jgi:CheY-like chemotaxis protein
MPGNPGGAHDPRGGSSAERGADGHYILLIDDEEAILDVLVALLRDEEGYQVCAARSGVEALQIAPERPPALVLMDATLRNEITEDVVRSLRSRPGWEGVAVVIVTAAPRIQQLAEQLNARAYLAKPFDLDDLLALVARFGVRQRRSNPT